MDWKGVELQIGTLSTSTTTSTTFRYYYYLDGGIGDIGVWGIFNVSYKYPEWGKVPDHLLFAHQKCMKKRKYI